MNKELGRFRGVLWGGILFGTAIIFLCIVFLAATYLLSKNPKTDPENTFFQDPVITSWLPEEKFEVTGTKKVEGLDMGRVFIVRARDGHKFSAWAVPFREIPIGSQV